MPGPPPGPPKNSGGKPAPGLPGIPGLGKPNPGGKPGGIPGAPGGIPWGGGGPIEAVVVVAPQLVAVAEDVGEVVVEFGDPGECCCCCAWCS